MKLIKHYVMKTDIQDIYEQVGNLFYAIAKEQDIKPIQLGELKLVVSENWLPGYNESNDYFPTPAAHTILITLDALQASDMTAREAYNKFVGFYILHTHVFTHELRIHILETVFEIARIFSPPASSIPNQFVEAVQQLFQPPE